MTSEQPKVVATMCMLHGRYPESFKTIDSLKGQVDTLYLCLNGFWEVPPELRQDWIKILHFGKNMGDAARFYLLRNLNLPDTHVLTCDDDIVYPETYCADMLAAHEQYPNAVLSHHGDTADYGNGGKLRYRVEGGIRLFEENLETKYLAIGGSGVSFFPQSVFNQLHFTSLVHFNMVDVHIACNLLKLDIPIIGLPHTKDYLGYKQPAEPTLYWTVTSKPDYLGKVYAIYASYGLNPADPGHPGTDSSRSPVPAAGRKEAADSIRGEVLAGTGRTSQIPEDLLRPRRKAAQAKLKRGTLNIKPDDIKQALDWLGKPDFATDQPDNPLRWWGVELLPETATETPALPAKTFVVRHEHAPPDRPLEIMSEAHLRTELNLDTGSAVQLRRVEVPPPTPGQGVVATMCMSAERWPGSLKTIRSLEGQVDTLYLCLNDFWKVPPELDLDWIEILHIGENLGDTARFYLLRHLGPLDEHVISCDDDIEYPKTYVQDFLAAHKTYPNALLTHHADTADYVGDGEIKISQGIRIMQEHEAFRHDMNLPGSGVSFIPGQVFNRMEFTSLVHLSQSDVHLACNCIKTGTPVIGMPHSEGYFACEYLSGNGAAGAITDGPAERMKKMQAIYASYGMSPPPDPRQPIANAESPMFIFSSMPDSRYAADHARFYKLWLRQNGYQYTEAQKSLGITKCWFKWNGLEGVICFSDFAVPPRNDPDYDTEHLFYEGEYSSIPVFKAHYSRTHSYPKNFFPLAPTLCGIKGDGKRKAIANLLEHCVSFETTPQAGFTCKQHARGGALDRRKKVQSMLKQHFPDTDIDHKDGPVGFWNAHKTKLAAVCVPGAHNNMLDRGQAELMMLGVCTISPNLPEVLLDGILLEPNEDYLQCADDYSDLIDICRSLTPERAKQIGDNARRKMAAMRPKPFWDYVIRTLQDWYDKPASSPLARRAA